MCVLSDSSSEDEEEEIEEKKVNNGQIQKYLDIPANKNLNHLKSLCENTVIWRPGRNLINFRFVTELLTAARFKN